MNICIIGKFPPIQGGVSAQTHWLSAQLAIRGHSVRLLTNADEVEQGYRQVFLPGEWALGSARCGLNQQLEVESTSRTPPGSYYHVPFSNPYLNKLFGLGAELIESSKPDLIFGWYFEPYGMVATMLGRIFNVPVVIKHAGSDLGRLALNADLAKAYRWMLRNATAISSAGRRPPGSFLAEAGVPEEKIYPSFGTRLPNYFNESAPFDLTAYIQAADAWVRQLNLPQGQLDGISLLNRKQLTGAPVIGSYGKIGQTKGSYDLLKALEDLAIAGYEFSFVNLAAGSGPELMRYYNAVLSSHQSLVERTWILPPVPPWRIPEFLELCGVVCFLERDFPITAHHPVVAREVIMKGRCLVVSQEIANKQAFYSNLVDGKNAVIIPNPKETSVLSQKLKALLESTDAIANISGHAKCLGRFLEAHLPEISGEVQLVEALLSEGSRQTSDAFL